MKTIHFLVTLARSAHVIVELKKKHNFDIRYDDETMGMVVDFVFLRTLSDKEIVKEIMEMHTINLKDLAPQ